MSHTEKLRFKPKTSLVLPHQVQDFNKPFQDIDLTTEAFYGLIQDFSIVIFRPLA